METISAPRVSVIIPTYNSESTIARAINSVICQSFQDTEIIICDDASTDSTLEIVYKLKTKHKNQKIIVHKLPSNEGAGAARNLGMLHAKGEYIAFLDSDDEWLTEKRRSLQHRPSFCFTPVNQRIH
jgi:glycosyltransferase involved in cell wall biosynthesis